MSTPTPQPVAQVTEKHFGDPVKHQPEPQNNKDGGLSVISDRELLHKWFGGMASVWEDKIGRGSLLEIAKTCERALQDLRTWTEVNRGNNVNADAIYGYIDAKLAQRGNNGSGEDA